MTKSTWRACSDALISASAVAIVLIVIVAADARVREQARSLVDTAPSYTVASASAEVRRVGSVLWLSARERSLDHGPVVVFVATAAVLLLCMMRR
jgi:hypothetical protein